jgi:hypothetical protein
MRVDWNDRLCVYQRQESNGRYEADDDTWGTYTALLEVKIELEEQIRQSPEADPLDHIDDDLKALRDMLPDTELLLLHQKRHVGEVVTTKPDPIAEALGPLPEAPLPPMLGHVECSRNAAGKHIAATYLRHSDGRLIGKCKCGHMMQNPDCPHLTQALRGNKVVCAECGRPQINNVGHTENDADHPAAVDPGRFTP